MRATACIGAVFGDECKGRMVDVFSHAPHTLVVRYNGGAQASHTVTRSDGTRHAFSHFGAGSFNGMTTYLSSYFIANPFLWQMERDALLKLGLRPSLLVSPVARVTTPYDMLINTELEKSRGNSRHGSCGYGINETVERDLTEYSLLVRDLRDDLRGRLRVIRSEYVPVRLKALGITKFSDEFLQLIDNQQVLESYLKFSGEFLAGTSDLRDHEIGDLRHSWDNVVFEGAQGLLLDEDNTEFHPHLTRSKCGLANINSICAKAGIKELQAVYITRAYATRHGDGPFPTWDKSLSYEDRTNKPNPNQGAMRFGKFNLDLLMKAVQADLQKAPNLEVTHSLAMTCLDQVSEQVSYVHNGVEQSIDKSRLPTLAACAINAKCVYLSSSQTGPVVGRAAARHRGVRTAHTPQGAFA